MDERDMRELLRGYLDGADWSRGLSKQDLIDRVDDDALRVVVDQYIAGGVYFSAEDVFSVIPEQAWQAAQGDTWRGGAPPEETEAYSRFLDSPVAHDRPSTDAGFPGIVRQTVGHAAQALAHTATNVADQARERAGAVAQARDQVVRITTKGHDAAPTAEAAGKPKRSLAPVALSATMEGLGQAYNRQPVKALVFAAAGLTLSTASGLNTWIARNVFRARRVTLGPTEIKPGLLGLWAATFAVNLVDAWRNGHSSGEGAGSAETATPPSATWADLQSDRAGTTSPSESTEEFPAITPS